MMPELWQGLLITAGLGWMTYMAAQTRSARISIDVLAKEVHSAITAVEISVARIEERTRTSVEDAQRLTRLEERIRQLEQHLRQQSQAGGG